MLFLLVFTSFFFFWLWIDWECYLGSNLLGLLRGKFFVVILGSRSRSISGLRFRIVGSGSLVFTSVARNCTYNTAKVLLPRVLSFSYVCV